MNKLYTSIILIAVSLFLMSNSGGRGAAAGEAVTGAPGERTCAAAGCHNGGSFDPAASLELISTFGDEQAVSGYKAGRDYTARLTITAGGSPGGYGFQMVAMDASGNSVGTWTTSGNTQIADIGGQSYVEHSDIIQESVINLNWQAPDADLGALTFFYSANVVNGNGGTSGDSGTNSSTVIEFDPTLSTETELVENVKFFPNPASDMINVTNHNSDTFTIYNVQGILIKQGNLNYDQINISELNPGMYVVKLDNQKEISRFIKI